MPAIMNYTQIPNSLDQSLYKSAPSPIGSGKMLIAADRDLRKLGRGWKRIELLTQIPRQSLTRQNQGFLMCEEVLTRQSAADDTTPCSPSNGDSGIRKK
jgi:hypothetical protein